MAMKNWKYRNEAESESGEEPKVFTIEKPNSEVAPQGNKIYFYSDVSKDSILTLNRQIDELTKQMKIVQFTYNLPEPPAIEIHLCSDGGDVFAAMASVDKIMDNPVPVDTYCEGLVASAATLLSSVGRKRYITKSSCMLLHQISGEFWGSYAELKDEHANFGLTMELLKNIYLKRTKFKPKELDELLKHDLYMDASKCLKSGLVDFII
jgi:ATP-dependent protease ClpP protease subunit